jgi:hypothetical protein
MMIGDDVAVGTDDEAGAGVANRLARFRIVRRVAFSAAAFALNSPALLL